MSRFYVSHAVLLHHDWRLECALIERHLFLVSLTRSVKYVCERSALNQGSVHALGPLERPGSE